MKVEKNEDLLKATVCDPAQRTVNTGAKCGAEDDFYYFRCFQCHHLQ